MASALSRGNEPVALCEIEQLSTEPHAVQVQSDDDLVHWPLLHATAVA